MSKSLKSAARATSGSIEVKSKVSAGKMSKELVMLPAICRPAQVAKSAAQF